MCQAPVEHGATRRACAHTVVVNGVTGGMLKRMWTQPAPAEIIPALNQQPGVMLSAQHRLALAGPAGHAPALLPPQRGGVVEPRLIVLVPPQGLQKLRKITAFVALGAPESRYCSTPALDGEWTPALKHDVVPLPEGSGRVGGMMTSRSFRKGVPTFCAPSSVANARGRRQGAKVRSMVGSRGRGRRRTGAHRRTALDRTGWG